jgi:hypothetical protein
MASLRARLGFAWVRCANSNRAPGPLRRRPLGWVCGSASSPSRAVASSLAQQDQAIPPIERASAANMHVGGWTATQVDSAQVISNRLPVFMAVVIGVSALLLLVVFRSLVIPIQNRSDVSAQPNGAPGVTERGVSAPA